MTSTRPESLYNNPDILFLSPRLAKTSPEVIISTGCNMENGASTAPSPLAIPIRA